MNLCPKIPDLNSTPIGVGIYGAISFLLNHRILSGVITPERDSIPSGFLKKSTGQPENSTAITPGRGGTITAFQSQILQKIH